MIHLLPVHSGSLRLLELIGLNIGLKNGNYLLNNLGCVILLYWLTIFAKLLILLPFVLPAASYSLEVLKLIRLNMPYFCRIKLFYLANFI